MTVFSKIIKGELSSNKVLENDNFLAFHDTNPKAPVHILIIPKIEVENFQSLDPKIMTGMTKFIQEVAVLMGLDKSGYRLITNNGEDARQEVFHLHFHMLGGTKLGQDKIENTDTKKFL